MDPSPIATVVEPKNCGDNVDIKEEPKVKDGKSSGVGCRDIEDKRKVKANEPILKSISRPLPSFYID